MSEFRNRIEAQRDVLTLINKQKYKEPLLGLTDKAINRWGINNEINSQGNVIRLLKEISSCLFFLANKSQEQVTEDYKNLSGQVTNLINELKKELACSV